MKNQANQPQSFLVALPVCERDDDRRMTYVVLRVNPMGEPQCLKSLVTLVIVSESGFVKLQLFGCSWTACMWTSRDR